MPSKLQFYSEFAERTARQITGSYRSWTAFLATAARLYKYPYNEQLSGILYIYSKKGWCLFYEHKNTTYISSRKCIACGGGSWV